MAGRRKARDDHSDSDKYFEKENEEKSKEDAIKESMEEEYEEEELKSKKKRVKNMFLDVEAAVDEEEEEEEFEEGHDEEFIDEQETAEAEREYSRLLAAPRPKPTLEENFDPEAEAQRLKELYGRSATVSKLLEEVEHLPETLLAPSVSDSKLWLVKCRPGKERDVIQSLWKKYRDREYSDRPLQITSAITRDHLKGYFYVEAFRQIDVVMALEHVPHVFSSKPALVPIEEMIPVLKIPPRQVPVKIDAWIRVKRGKYAGDLAQVIDIDEVMEKATIRLVPRLESHLLTGGNKSSTSRPNAKLFFPEALPSHLRRQVSRPVHSKRHWMYHGEKFTTDGYLEKEMLWSGLDCDPSIQPSLEEIALFAGLDSNVKNGDKIDASNTVERISKLPSIINRSSCTFSPEDLVRVIEGDLSQQMAKIVSIDGENAIVKPLDPSMSFHVTIPIISLVKEFRIGDHVRISGTGKYSGEVGLVVSIEDDSQTAVVFLDSSKQQITVLIRDIVSSDVGRHITNTIKNQKKSSTPFQLEDLVVLNDQQHTIALVLNYNVGSDTLKVLDQNCIVMDVDVSSVKSYPTTRHSSLVYDTYSNQVCIGNKVQVLHGDNAQLQGAVVQIYRQNVFIRAPELYESGGYLCVKNSNISLVNERGDLCIPSGPGQSMSFSRSSSTRQQNDSILGSTVVICTGLYKGKMGSVRTSYDNSLEIDLHTGKRVTVNRSDVQLSGELGLTTTQSGPKSWDTYGGRTPGGGFRTPYQDGSKTPWDTYGGRTPALTGGKTPSWTTPHVVSGYKTPLGAGSKTPMIQRDYSHDSNGGYMTPGLQAPKSPPQFVHPSRIAHIDTGSRIRPNIEVSVNNVDEATNGTRAVVQSIDSANDDVVISLIDDENVIIRTSIDKLSIIRPKRNDSAIVVAGDKTGASGTVIGQDNTDLLIKPSIGDVMIVNVDDVAILHVK